MLFGVLTVLTKKGTTYTTVSNQYLAEALGIKSESRISLILRDLKDRKFVKTCRGLGRRQISLNTKGLLEAGLITKLREVKNDKKK